MSALLAVFADLGDIASASIVFAPLSRVARVAAVLHATCVSIGTSVAACSGCLQRRHGQAAVSRTNHPSVSSRHVTVPIVGSQGRIGARLRMRRAQRCALLVKIAAPSPVRTARDGSRARLFHVDGNLIRFVVGSQTMARAEWSQASVVRARVRARAFGSALRRLSRAIPRVASQEGSQSCQRQVGAGWRRRLNGQPFE